MTLSASTIFEVRSTATAANTNGAGFNPANANGLTDGVIASGTGNSPTLTSSGYSFAAGDVGAKVYFPTQANMINGFFEIASVSSGVATLTASVGNAVVMDANTLLWTPNTSAGCATTGAPTGVTYLVDYSQQNGAQLDRTNLGSASGSTTLTDNSAGGLFTKVMVGNLIHITAGTNATVGWYEIVSWTDANNVVLDRTPHGANVMSATTGHVGGAANLGQLDATFGPLGTSSATAGNIVYVKSGSYSLGAAFTTVAGNAAWQSRWEGYKTIRGDRPTLYSDMPAINNQTRAITLAANSSAYFLNIFGTSTTSLIIGGVGSYIVNCKVDNQSTNNGANAINISGAHSAALRCEASSYRGTGIVVGNTTGYIVKDNWVHSSDIGVSMNTSSVCVVTGNIISDCLTEAILVPNLALGLISENTLYGAANKRGIGINFNNASVLTVIVENNIITGFATGIDTSGNQNCLLGNNNCFYNNTVDVSSAAEWRKGINDIAVDPAFSNVVQRTGATATLTAGNHIVQTGALFVTWGITVNDHIYIKSGTGATAGMYGIVSIDSETQLTLTGNAGANATADKVWEITQGNNFLPTGLV